MYLNEFLERKIKCGSDFSELYSSALDSTYNVCFSFVNPFSYGIVADRKELIEEFDYWFSDGALLCVLTNLRRKKKISRASFDFSSIASVVFDEAVARNKSIALVGATDIEVKQAKEYIQSRYPKLQICFCRDGYIDQKDFSSVSNSIKASNADVIICGMGTPVQEEFIVKLKCQMEGKVFFTCGGFLTQTGVSGDYYSPLVKKLGLRWLQRAFLHKHVRDRLLSEYPKFILSYLLNKRLFK